MRCIREWLMGLLLLPACLWAASPVEILTQRLQAIQTLQGDYLQTAQDAEFGQDEKLSGHVIMKRPNQFLWVTQKPYEQYLLSDGKEFWMYDPGLKQVLIRPLTLSVQDAPALLFIGQTGDVSKDFNVTLTEPSPWVEHFVLTPKTEDTLIHHMDLIFRAQVIETLHIQDNLSQHMEIVFSKVHLNENIPADRFTLNIPKGTDIIR